MVGLYNPYPLALPPPGGDLNTGLFNSLLSGDAKTVGGLFANPLPRFNPGGFASESSDIPSICEYTAMCPGGIYNPASPEADIHPTPVGYAVMAEVIDGLFTPPGPAGATGATGENRRPSGPTGPKVPKVPEGGRR